MNCFTFVQDWLILNLKRKHCWHIGLWEHWWTNNIQMWTATLILSISLYIGIIFNKPPIVWHQILEEGKFLSIVYFHFGFQIQGRNQCCCMHNVRTLLAAALNFQQCRCDCQHHNQHYGHFHCHCQVRSWCPRVLICKKRPPQCNEAQFVSSWVSDWQLTSWVIYLDLLLVHKI